MVVILPGAILQEENTEEEDLLDELASALTTILREYGDAAMPWIDGIMPQIGQLLDQSRSPAERRIGICIIDDLLEHSAAGESQQMGCHTRGRSLHHPPGEQRLTLPCSISIHIYCQGSAPFCSYVWDAHLGLAALCCKPWSLQPCQCSSTI